MKHTHRFTFGVNYRVFAYEMSVDVYENNFRQTSIAKDQMNKVMNV